MGANHIINSTIFSIKLFPETKKLIKFSEEDNDLTPNPTNKEKTIIWSISPFAIAAIGFVGKIFTNTSFNEGGVGVTNFASDISPAPLPMLIKFEKNKANEIAIEVVAKYKNIALILIEPNLEESVICATPVTREKNTKGTTINFKDEINIVPKALKISIENTTKL